MTFYLPLSRTSHIRPRRGLDLLLGQFCHSRLATLRVQCFVHIVFQCLLPVAFPFFPRPVSLYSVFFTYSRLAPNLPDLNRICGRMRALVSSIWQIA